MNSRPNPLTTRFGDKVNLDMSSHLNEELHPRRELQMSQQKLDRRAHSIERAVGE